ncbi:MAG: hypothetical protein QXM48_02665 [Sulfolobales archaeon]
MKLPDLTTVADLYEVLNAGRFKEVMSRWALIKSLPLGRVIIKPVVSSFDETPNVVIDESMTTKCNGVWIVRGDGGSKVYLRDGSELYVNCRAYTMEGDLILKVCSDAVSVLNVGSGDEEILLEGYNGVDIRNLGGSSVAFITTSNKEFLIGPQIKNKIIEIQDHIYADSRTTALIAFKHKKKYYVVIHLKFLNFSKIYEVDRCDSVEEVLVGDGLGVIKCSNISYLISVEEMLKIPFLLEPVADVRHEYLLYDNKFNVLIRFDGRSLNQLLIPSKPKVLGKLSSGELITVSNGNPYMITDNVWRVLTGSKVLYGSADGEYIILRSHKSLELFKHTSHISSFRPLECGLINNNLICVHNGNILIYDLDELHDADLRITTAELNVSKYPILTVTPWHENYRLIVKGPVSISPELRTSQLKSKSFIVKPLLLGRELTFKAVYDVILTQISRELRVRANKLELKNLLIGEVKHSLNGFVEGTEENTLVSMYLEVFNPTPEEVQLIITYSTNEDGGYNVKHRYYFLKPGINNLMVRETLKTNAKILQVLITYKWFNRVEHLAMTTLDLSKYLVEDPVSSLNYNVGLLGECTSKLVVTPNFSSKVEVPIKVVVTCLNGKTFYGVNEVVLDECLLPATIEYSYSYDGISWRKYHVMRDTPSINLSLRPGYGLGLNVSENRRCVNGFLHSDTNLDLSLTHPVSKLDVEPRINEDGDLYLRISYKLLNEGVVLALCGDKPSLSAGSEGTLDVVVKDPITNDLKVVVLSNGVKELYTVDNVTLIKKYVEFSNSIATLLKSKLLIWGGFGDSFRTT